MHTYVKSKDIYRYQYLWLHKVNDNSVSGFKFYVRDELISKILLII